MAPSNESKQSHLGIYNAMMRAEGRHLFTTSDEDDVIMKQILATHAYDCQEIDIRALLKVVEEIFQPSTPSTPAPLAWYMDRLDQRTEQTAFVGMPEALVVLIYNICFEV
ncbi:uncharacterized protein LOC122066105 [Macadamia integrifolia]|uniref:uncharacterized protein LOC122066105 n=1 Tax=Macadamia integrifolia TaxID=60698 RepID=UPI001C4E88BF|nr:uncharacterized protein LOC122066105 [Macadamia integrifolia]